MRGGAREGAGRKPGVPNKNPRKKVEAKSTIGPMPADMMLDIARYHYGRTLNLRRASGAKRDEGEIRIESSLTLAAADKVAKFYHPTLATLQSNVNLTGRLTLDQLVTETMKLHHERAANSNVPEDVEEKDADAQ